MRLAYYAMFSIVFVVVVFAACFMLCMYHYDLSPDISLHISLWICVPIGVFAIGVGVALFVSKVRNFLDTKRLKKDHNALVFYLYTQAKELESKNPTPIPTLYYEDNQILARILARFSLTPRLHSPESSELRIDKLFTLYTHIEQGTLEDTRKFALGEQNPFALQNRKNFAQKSNKNALEVLDDARSDVLLRGFALRTICESQKEKDIQKALKSAGCNGLYTADIQDALLWCAKLHITLTSAQIATLCMSASADSTSIANTFASTPAFVSTQNAPQAQGIESNTHTSSTSSNIAQVPSIESHKVDSSVGFKQQDYLALAQALHSVQTPDEWLAYFKGLAECDEKAHNAYVFVLLELEMVERAEQELKGVSADELLGLRAYVELKRSHKNYPLKAFHSEL